MADKLKQKTHPKGMIDLTIVPYSEVASNEIKKMCKIPLCHHVLIVDMGCKH